MDKYLCCNKPYMIITELLHAVYYSNDKSIAQLEYFVNKLMNALLE